MEKFGSLLQVADFIDVLWILKDGSEYWWRATVLGIEPKKSKSFIASGLIQYEPGPSVDFLSDYKVHFFADEYIYHVEGKKRERPYRQNSWKPISITQSCSGSGGNSELSDIGTNINKERKIRSANDEVVPQPATNQDTSFDVDINISQRLKGVESNMISMMKK